MAGSEARQATWNSVALLIIFGCIISMLSFGSRSAFGLLLGPITEAREWSREIFGFALALQNLIWGMAQPAAGALAEKYGTARVLAIGGILYAIGLVVTAWADTPLWLDVGAGILVGLGVAGSSFAIVIAAFGRAVTESQRSMAFGIGMASGSAGQFVFAPMSQMLINNYGWQQTLFILAALTMIIPFLVYPLRGKSEPDPNSTAPDLPLKTAILQAFGHKSYLLLTAGFFVCGFQVAFITVHLPAYIVDIGLDASVGAWAIAVIGFCNIIGALMAGIIGSKYSKTMSLSLLYIARSILVTWFILTPPSALNVMIFAALMGFLWLSTVPLTSALVVVMFGPRYMATLFGFVFFSHQLGSFIGVWLGGWMYDQYQTYDGVWWLSVVLGIFAAIIHWPIKEQAYGAAEQASA